MISPDVAEGGEEGGRAALGPLSEPLGGRELLSPGSRTTPPRRGAGLRLNLRVLGPCQPPRRL